MANTLQIPQQPTIAPTIAPSQPDLDSLLDRIEKQESGGNAKAVGKAGERGSFQIKPSVAAMYGISPDLLFNPQVSRYVARRYMTDLISQFKGDVPKAVAAYNAGPGNVAKGNIPASTKQYVAAVIGNRGGRGQFSIGSLFGEGTAEAAEPYTGPVLSTKPSGGSYSGPVSSAKPTSYTGPVLPAKPDSKPEPFGARVAGYLPMAGQFGGEALGALGGAAIPGAGETGIPEYAGAVAGGAAGSAGGAELENIIRKRYGLPPVSVGSEAAWGGAGSAVGGLIPPVLRYRKAAALAKSEGISFKAALSQLQGAEAGLEGTLGMGPGKAKLLEDASGAPAKNAYNATRARGLDEIGSQYDSIIGSDAHKLTPTTAAQTLQGPAGKILDLVGKPLRHSIEDEFSKAPMTVSRVQKLISVVRSQKRLLNPETQGMALKAYDDIIKALQADRDAVVGPSKAAAIKVVDGYYARQIARFPLKAVRKATTETGAAEAILAHKPSEVGRTLQVIREMERTGNVGALRRATAALLYQVAKVREAASPIARLDRLTDAVNKVEPEVFDELYGMGARKQWLDTAAALTKRQRELLAHPNEAAAVAMAVRTFLKSPGMIAKVSNHFLQHRALFGALMMAGGAEFGSKEFVAAGGALLGIEGYEIAMHSRLAMKLLEKAALSKDPQVAAKLIVSAMSTAIRGGAESALGGDQNAK